MELAGRRPLAAAVGVAGAAAALAVGVGVLGVRRIHRRCGRMLRDLAAVIAAAQKNPSHQPFLPAGTTTPTGDLPLVLNRLDGLVECYRHALNEVVRAQELLKRGPRTTTAAAPPTTPSVRRATSAPAPADE